MKIYSISDPEVKNMLNQGLIGVIPTDTVYGVVGCLDNKVAVRRILKLKSRTTKPIGTILVGEVEQLVPVVQKRIDAPERFWPGPVSVILPVRRKYAYAHQNLNSLAFRIPSDGALRGLAASTGLIATTSANLPGELPASTAEEAIKIFGNRVDFYVDGGVLTNRRASKIIKIQDNGTIEIIREG